MILVALAIFVFTLIFFSIEAVVVLAIAALLFGSLCLYCQRRLDDRYTAIDWALQLDDPARVIADDRHPLWSFGARRGPEPPEQTATGRFR